MSLRTRAAVFLAALVLPTTIAFAEAVSLDEAVSKALAVTPIAQANDASITAARISPVRPV